MNYHNISFTHFNILALFSTKNDDKNILCLDIISKLEGILQ